MIKIKYLYNLTQKKKKKKIKYLYYIHWVVRKKNVIQKYTTDSMIKNLFLIMLVFEMGFTEWLVPILWTLDTWQIVGAFLSKP